jgi:hypothetical protein
MLRNLWIDEFSPVIYREDGSQPPLDTRLSHADRPYPRDFVPSLWSGARCVY